ncbi:unnamed protein product [Phytophthora lilii]|uniref:RxLR effector protein n=1 Tax=Phytophthora lilii TaxID=2077276 RepID=A0A9W6U2Y3_9STRA|nr:unnamed protein product [Phytophthora lilii]
MRAFLALVLVLMALLASANALSVSAIESKTLAEIDTKEGRLLRTDQAIDGPIDPNEEERGITDIAKKFGAWIKDRPSWLLVKAQSGALNQDAVVKLFLQKNINPDKVYMWLKIARVSDDIPERTLWVNFANAWKRKNPTKKLMFDPPVA